MSSSDAMTPSVKAPLPRGRGGVAVCENAAILRDMDGHRIIKYSNIYDVFYLKP